MKHFFLSMAISFLIAEKVVAASNPDNLSVNIQINRQRHSRFAPILAISEKRSDIWHIEDDKRLLKKILVTRFVKVPIVLQNFSATKISFFIDGCDLAKLLALSNLENCDANTHPIYLSLTHDQPTLVSLNFLDDDAREVIFSIDH